MVRTQVYFSEEQHRALRQAAKCEGISMTALLRRMVERELLGRFQSQDYAKDAIMAFADLGRSGRSDISDNHDEALAEAFRDETIR
ncbi:MAG: CopG family transcriptional regulator [Geminicoccaceae bacterium]